MDDLQDLLAAAAPEGVRDGYLLHVRTTGGASAIAAAGLAVAGGP